MRWDLMSRARGEFFEHKLPAGKYYIGDPEEMLLTGVLLTTKPLANGIYQDYVSESSIVICQFEFDDFLLNDNADDMHVSSKSGIVAIMSENIVKPLPEFNGRSISFGQTFVIEVNTDFLTVLMWHEGREVKMYPNDPNVEIEETDEQMYTRLYAAIGIDY